MAKAMKMSLSDGEGCDFCVPYPASPQDRFMGEQLDYMRSLHPEESDRQLRQMVLQEWNDDLSEEQKSHYFEEYEDETKVWMEEHETHHSTQGTVCDSMSSDGVSTGNEFIQTEEEDSLTTETIVGQSLPRKGKRKRKVSDGIAANFHRNFTENFEQMGNIYTCKRCGKDIKDQQSAVRHYEGHLDEGFEYLCPKCNKVKKDRHNLYQHMRTNHGLKLDVADLEAYRRAWTGKKKDCPDCQESFVSQKDLERHHIDTHVDLDCEYQCPNCSIVMGKRYQLQTHLRLEHGRHVWDKTLDNFKLTQ